MRDDQGMAYARLHGTEREIRRYDDSVRDAMRQGDRKTGRYYIRLGLELRAQLPRLEQEFDDADRRLRYFEDMAIAFRVCDDPKATNP